MLEESREHVFSWSECLFVFCFLFPTITVGLPGVPFWMKMRNFFSVELLQCGWDEAHLKSFEIRC